jgi:hypothetical protein
MTHGANLSRAFSFARMLALTPPDRLIIAAIAALAVALKTADEF